MNKRRKLLTWLLLSAFVLFGAIDHALNFPVWFSVTVMLIIVVCFFSVKGGFSRWIN